jgi:protein-S-isoprenylcysteine O-methyltransferase Ste14
MALQEEFGEQGKWLFRYRGVLPIIILGIGMVVYLLGRISSNPFYLWGTSMENYFELSCLFVGLLGLVIRVYTVGYTPRATSGRGVKKFVASTLNTKGPYSLVRHPLYVGNFFMWLGPTLLTANVWFIVSFCLFYWIY